MNTGIQVAQCSSATINLNPISSDTNAPFPDKGNLDSPSISTSNYIIRTQAPVDLSTISTERQTAFKSSDTATSSLIGTTIERQRIQREIQTLTLSL